MAVSAKHRTKTVSAIITLATALSLCVTVLTACSAADSENESGTENASAEESSLNSEESDAAESDNAESAEEGASGAENAGDENIGDQAANDADEEPPAESVPNQTANTDNEPAKQPSASSSQTQTPGSDPSNATAPGTDQTTCYHDWQLNIVKTYQPVKEDAMLCNECELWMKSESEIDAHRKANGWGTGHGGWHSGTHYAGYCANCGGRFEWVQDHFSRPNCHNQYIQNCSCGRNELMYYNGAGIVVDGKICSLCGATDPNR